MEASSGSGPCRKATIQRTAAAVEDCVRAHQVRGEIVTGLLYINESVPDLHETSRTPETPLVDIPFEKLSPGVAELEALQEEYR